MNRSTDLLSEVLSSVHARSVVTGRFVFTAPWAYSRDAVPGCAFRICSGAPFYLRVRGQPAVRIDPGDLVLLPRGAAHVISSSPHLPAQSFDVIVADAPLHEPLSRHAGGGGDETRLHAGLIHYETTHTDILFKPLPEVMHFRAEDAHLAPWLATTLKAFINESMRRDAGWQVAATKLAELLLVDVLRIYIQRQDNTLETGWLRGLTDPRIAHALGLMHAQLDKDWSVASLACEVGMSRSRFVALFETLVGEPPISYLQNHRLRTAAQLLNSHPKPVNLNVALAVGYQSEKGFARAFTRRYGVSPGSYSRQHARPHGTVCG